MIRLRGGPMDGAAFELQDIMESMEVWTSISFDEPGYRVHAYELDEDTRWQEEIVFIHKGVTRTWTPHD